MIRIRLLCTGVAGSPWYTNLHFLAGLDSAQQATDQVHAFVQQILNSFSNQVDWDITDDVVQIDPATGKATDAVAVSGYTSTSANTQQIVPTAVQALIRTRTNAYERGRRIAGKIYLGGATTGNLGPDGQWLGAFTALLTTAADQHLMGTGASGNVPLCVWSRTAGEAYAALSADTWAETAVLRSRRD